jgi:histidinol-phosphate/aromatic aminotransferase/cobyric acid decarboxylase-like protein
VLDGRPAPAATLSPVCVSTSSLTKAYGLASLRCGWVLASDELARKIRRSRDAVDVWSPIPSDRLSVLAFDRLDALAARSRALVEANLERVTAWLASPPSRRDSSA